MKSLFLTVLLALTLPLAAAPMTAAANEAFVLLNGASIFKEKSMGVLDWADSVTVGDKLIVTSGVTKMKYNSNERDYYKVKLANGTEGFIRTNLVGVGGTLGVVKADVSFLYSEPRDVKVTEKTLARGQMVVVFKDGMTDSFIKISAYDVGKDTPVTEMYVSRDDVSVNDIDANAVILLSVAKAQKNDTIRKNLLTVASNKYSTSLFIDLVKAQLDLLSPAPRAAKAASGSMVTNDSKVNVRDLPNEKGSKVVGTLDKGVSVDLIEMTSDTYTVDGKTAAWYHIKAPDGWVFGSFLTGQ